MTSISLITKTILDIAKTAQASPKSKYANSPFGFTLAVAALIDYCVFSSDKIVTQVLDELGIQMGEELLNLPSAAGSLKQPDTGSKQAEALTDADADLQARLEKLRRE